MIIADLHCDTTNKLFHRKISLHENDCHVDLMRMHKYENYIQVFAVFIEPCFYNQWAIRCAVRIINHFKKQITEHKEKVVLCGCYEDIKLALDSEKVSAVLSVEGGEVLEGDIRNLDVLYKLGVRSLGLTWNHANKLAGGINTDPDKKGLTEFGRMIVEQMNRIGMIIDLTHIDEKAFFEVLDITKLPVIVSHANAAGLAENKRNLTDKQICAINKNQGIIGVTFYPSFLCATNTANISHVIQHIEYIASLAGIDTVAIGSDFDGVDNLPAGIEGVQDLEKLVEVLLHLNYQEDYIKKIFHTNFLRIFKAVCL